MSARVAAKDSSATAGDASRAKGLGLGTVGSLSGLMKKHEPNRPMELALTLIDEDPAQPRSERNPGFRKESLEELAASIALRGVKTPISVRANADQPGRFIINHGARRYRSSKIAGKKSIPAFIDQDYGSVDQILENIAREELTAREIADYVGREIAKDRTQREIATELSKSQSWVAQYATLLKLPDSIQEAFNAGRTSDVTLINELVKAYKKDSEEVDQWLGVASQEISRQSVQALRGGIETKIAQASQERPPAPAARLDTDPSGSGSNASSEGANSASLTASGLTSAGTGAPASAPASDTQPPQSPNMGDAQAAEGQPNGAAASSVKTSASATASGDPSKLKRAIVQVRFNERPARLMLDRRPPAPGWAWLKFDEDGQEVEADLSAVRLFAVVEG